MKSRCCLGVCVKGAAGEGLVSMLLLCGPDEFLTCIDLIF